MDAHKEIAMREEVDIDVFPIHHPEYYRQEKLADDKGLNKTDVIARAKAMGVREYRDRVILAIQDDDLKPEMGGMFSRSYVDVWINAELAVDHYEDQFTINLQQARALAKEAGLEDYSAAVLNAITRMEIEGVEYRRNQPRIPRDVFEAWIEDQRTEVEEDHEIDPELQAMRDGTWEPSPGANAVESVKIYMKSAVIIMLSLCVIVMVFVNSG